MINLNELPSYYTILFRAVSQAIQAMETRNYTTAEFLLLQGMREAEEAYLREEEKPEA